MTRFILVGVFLAAFSALGLRAQEATPSWDLSGDLRLRQEVDTNRPGGRPARQRTRIRLRLKAVGDLAPDWRLGARVRTGDHSIPVSANFTIASSPHHPETFDVVLDQAYLLYHPGGKSGFSLGLGKVQPLPTRSALDKMVLDTDYSPAGIRLAWSNAEWNLAGGSYVLDRTASAAGARAQIFQGGHTWSLSESSTVSLEFSYTDVSLLTDLAQREALRQNTGNRVVDRNGDGRPDAFASGFRILEPGLTVTWQAGEVPMAFDAQYLRNLGAPVSVGQGFGARLQAGRQSQAGDLQGYYRYHFLEQDAVFTPVAQDDFPLVSDFQGHAAGVLYRLAQGVTIHGWVLTSTPIDRSGPTIYRYRLDWQFQW